VRARRGNRFGGVAIYPLRNPPRKHRSRGALPRWGLRVEAMRGGARYLWGESAFVIDGRVICSGRTLGVREIKHWLL